MFWVFASVCMRNIVLWFSLFIVMSLWFWYKGNCGLTEWAETYFTVFNFRKVLVWNQNYFFIKYLVELTSEAILAQSFLCENVFNYKFNFLKRYKEIHVVYFFLNELSSNFQSYLSCWISWNKIVYKFPYYPFKICRISSDIYYSILVMEYW